MLVRGLTASGGGGTLTVDTTSVQPNALEVGAYYMVEINNATTTGAGTPSNCDILYEKIWPNYTTQYYAYYQRNYIIKAKSTDIELASNNVSCYKINI